MPAQPGAAPTPAPAAPGPPPAPIQRTNIPRIAAGAPINLPPGYNLPPGWAVIPAHNVQIIAPATQTVVGTGSPTMQAVVLQGLPAGTVAPQQGPPSPGSATSPTPGTGDVTISNNDHLAQTSSQTAGAASPRSPNINNPPSTTPTNSQSLNLQNLMQQRTAGQRMALPQSPHSAFPIVIPLVPSGASASGAAYQRSSATTRTDGVAETPNQPPPRVNGTTNSSTESGDTDERFAILSQMSHNISTMQNLVARMQSLNQPLPPATTPTTVPCQPATVSISPSSSPSTSNVLQPLSPNSETTSTPLMSPPGHNRMHKRRSMSPVGRYGENDAVAHPADRLHSLSSSDEELSPEELADIKAPWVEEPFEDELPLPEVRTSRIDCGQRMRSGSQSPSRQLRRRSSLLRHEITEEILDAERDLEEDGTLASLELKPAVVGSSNDGASWDKGKGKAVSVEDAEGDA